MKSRYSHLLVAFLVCVNGRFSWCQSSPQAALEELVTTEKAAVAETHYPEAVRHALQGLKKEARAETSQKLLVTEWLRGNGLTLHKNDDGNGWDLLSSQGQKISTFSIAETYFSGSNALVQLQTKPAPEQGLTSSSYFISMRLQDGDWQVTGFGNWRPTSLESGEFVSRFSPTAENETAARATLTQIWSALTNYHIQYPQVGYPGTLQALSGPEEQDQKKEENQEEQSDVQIVDGPPDTADDSRPSQRNLRPVPQYAHILDASFLQDPPVKDGYQFHYVLIDSGNSEDPDGKFHITATPVEFGKTGGRSFFMDQTGQIRATAEDRDANENDPLLTEGSMFFSTRALRNLGTNYDTYDVR